MFDEIGFLTERKAEAEALAANLGARLALLTAPPPVIAAPEPVPATPAPPKVPSPAEIQAALVAAFGVFSPGSSRGGSLLAWEKWKGGIPAAWVADNPKEGDRWATPPGIDWGGGEEASPRYSGIIWDLQDMVRSYTDKAKPVGQRNAVFALPLIPKSKWGDLKGLATGEHDAKHKRIAGILKPMLDRRRADGTPLRFRLRFWENNGSWMPAFAGPNPALFIEGVNRVIQVYKMVDPRFDFDFCVTLGTQGVDAFKIAPDVKLLKGWNADFYDVAWPVPHKQKPGMTAEEIDAVQKKRWLEGVLGGAQGLDAHAKFAAANGLEMNFSEWGCRNRPGNEDQTANGLDNPNFIQDAYDHFVDIVSGKYEAMTLGHQCYFERGDVRSSLSSGTGPNGTTLFPRAAERYKALFGA